MSGPGTLAGVEKPVMMGVTGTHSTGKTTFLARLTAELRRHHIDVGTVHDLGEQAQKRGIPILIHHTWASTLWIITRGISDELEAWNAYDVVLVDRAVPDALGYYLAALDYRNEPVDPDILAELETLVRQHSRRYDLIFRTVVDPSVPLGDNKQRDPNSDFRLLADHHIHRVLHHLDIPHTPLTPDSHDQAIAAAVEFITQRLDNS